MADVPRRKDSPEFAGGDIVEHRWGENSGRQRQRAKQRPDALPEDREVSILGSKDPYSLRSAIVRAAANIPFEQMMVIAADDARKLAIRYRDTGATETEILAAIVAAVQARRNAGAPT